MKTFRVRGTLAYKGTRYAGSQRQAGGLLTVQGELEHALGVVFEQEERVPVLFAGRTDAGVHARGQVIAFDVVAWDHRVRDLWWAINANLPHDIVLQDLTLAEADFHPRYDATSREYVYQFYTAPMRDPLLDVLNWYIGDEIDLDAMQKAADLLIGEHDFATFGKPTTGIITMREVRKAVFSTGADGIHRFNIEGNAFLQRMVRRIMGTLIQVGRGWRSLENFETVFRKADRTKGGPSAPAHGLILLKVNYDKPETLTGETENESKYLHPES